MGCEGIMDVEEDDTHHAKSSPTSSIEDSSTVSNGLSVSSSSSTSGMGDDEDDDDASSSLTSCSSNYSSFSGPLCDLSELMAQLPIKRGLSKFYQGKSQSFTSLSRVKNMEDLPKRETTRRRRKLYTLPKPIISKKIISRGQLPFSSSYFPSTRGSFVVSSCRPPMIPLQKNLGC